MKFEAQKVVFTFILDAGDQWIMAKIRFHSTFPLTPKISKKAFSFYHFSNFLKALRFCLGDQNTWNPAI